MTSRFTFALTVVALIAAENAELSIKRKAESAQISDLATSSPIPQSSMAMSAGPELVRRLIETTKPK